MNYDRICMDDEYEIRAHRFMDSRVLVLARCGKPDFMEELVSDPKSQQKAKLILETMCKIENRGVDSCLGRSNFIRMLDGNVGLAEVKIGGKVIRVMCHVGTINDRTETVLLFDFKGHGGKSGSIPKGMIKKGKRLASIARKCLEDGD